MNASVSQNARKAGTLQATAYNGARTVCRIKNEKQPIVLGIFNTGLSLDVIDKKNS